MPKRTPPTVSLDAIWERLEAALKAAAPEVKKSLRKGTTDAKLSKLGQQIGAELPADLRSTLLLHDGQKDDGDGIIPEDFVEEWGGEFLLMPVAEIATAWAMWKELTDCGEFTGRVSNPGKGALAVWWSPGWIPFATDGGGDYLCVDVTPAKGGTVGQVIHLKHDGGDRPVLSKSLAKYLLKLCRHWEESGEADDE